MAKYRFKTLEEFRKDSDLRGQTVYNWRDVPMGFISDMDHLLGKDYPYFIENLDEYIDDVDGFSISKEMLISKRPTKPNYKPRKLSRKI